jgi:hypothetical protein
VQHRFDLIIGCVRGRDIAGAALACRQCEEFITGSPRGAFDAFAAATGGKIVSGLGNDHFQAELIGQFLHERLIQVRFGSAESMVEVRQHKPPVAARSHFVERSRQGHAISPARNGD